MVRATASSAWTRRAPRPPTRTASVRHDAAGASVGSWNASRQSSSCSDLLRADGRTRRPRTCSSPPGFPPSIKVDGKVTPVTKQRAHRRAVARTRATAS
ncbi:MAG: hypothetical protein MZV65_12770 [Chromatiales bacterium]|nr:hypothetical protein [Chromatiales bacterium]